MEENNDEKRQFESQLEAIKYGIVTQIFEAGANWRTRCLESLDDNDNVPPEKQIDLQRQLEDTLDIYYNVVDLVWNQSVEEFENDESYVCDDCQRKIETNETIEKLEQELKKNKGKE